MHARARALCGSINVAAKSFSWTEYMRAWNTNDLDAILEHYAENCEVTGAEPAPIRGKAALRASLQRFSKAFSDMNGDAQVLVAQGEYVAALLRVTSKHTGPFEVGGKTIPATNKKLDDTAALFLQIDNNGKIRREWSVANQLATFQQLGVPPPMIAGAGR